MANMNCTYTKVIKWIKVITKFKLVFRHRPNTDKFVKLADGKLRLFFLLKDEPSRDVSKD